MVILLKNRYRKFWTEFQSRRLKMRISFSSRVHVIGLNKDFCSHTDTFSNKNEGNLKIQSNPYCSSNIIIEIVLIFYKVSFQHQQIILKIDA